jgi:hypothetical protein
LLYNKNNILQDVKDQLKFKYDQDELAYRKKSIGNCRYEHNKKREKLMILAVGTRYIFGFSDTCVSFIR